MSEPKKGWPGIGWCGFCGRGPAENKVHLFIVKVKVKRTQRNSLAQGGGEFSVMAENLGSAVSKTMDHIYANINKNCVEIDHVEIVPSSGKVMQI